MSDFIELMPADATRLKALITKLCGIVIDEKGTVMLEFRMHPILKKHKFDSFAALIAKAAQGRSELRDDLVDAITTNETLWFRDSYLYESLLEGILPGALGKARAAGRTGIRIWSAAASTGQEGYSLSMLLHEMKAQGQMTAAELSRTSIHGTDISPGTLRVARNATYDAISMGRGMLPGYDTRYFEKTGRSSKVKSEVASLVKFEQRNLLDSFSTLGKFDLVMIRNVLIYFSPEVKGDILNRISSNMHSDATLIVGSCEDASRFSKSY